MRPASCWILCLAWFASGCDGPLAVSPSAPIAGPPPPILMSPHSYRNANFQTPNVFFPIAVGDVISQRVTPQDPVCDPAWGFHCQYYRYVASREGLFEIAMVWKGPSVTLHDYPLDIDVTDPDNMTWDVTFLARTERRVQLRVEAGRVYWVGIWSAEAPGEPFVLTASLQED
jgi:hypothetical protein